MKKDEYRKEQHYAISTSGRLVHITEAHLSGEDFYCPHCKCRMLKNVETFEVGILLMITDISIILILIVHMSPISTRMLN